MSWDILIFGNLFGFREDDLIAIVIEEDSVFLDKFDFEIDDLAFFSTEEIVDFFLFCFLDLLDDNLASSLWCDTSES
ncbi:MAG: hypothetical protein ACD_78C00372G0001, partial [uncultured bacterium (gcode 4)]